MARSPRFYGWTVLAAYWLILIANIAFPLYGVSVINGYAAADLHLDRSTLGLVFGIFTAMIGLPAPLVAICVDRLGVRLTTVLGSLLLLTGALLMALFVSTGAQLVTVFGILIGLGFITGGPLCAQTCIAQWFVIRRSQAIALVLTGPTIGGFLAPVVLDRLITYFHGNWRVAWWLIAGMNMVAIILTLVLVKGKPSDMGQFPDGTPSRAEDVAAMARQSIRRRMTYKTSEEWTVSEVLSESKFWLVLIAAFGFYMGFPMFLAHGVMNLIDLEFTPAESAFSISVVLVSLLVGNIVVAVFGDYIESRFLFALASAAVGCGIYWSLNASGKVGLYGYAVLLGSGFGMGSTTIMTLPANYFGRKAYAAMVGVIMLVTAIAGASGPIFAGYAFDHFGGYAPAFRTVAILCMIGAVIALFLAPPVRRTTHSPTRATGCSHR